MKNHELVDALELNSVILENFVRQIPEPDLHRNRGEGFWTVYQHVFHLALVQPAMYKRFRMFKTEEKPVIVPYNPFTGEEKKISEVRPAVEIVQSFKDWRKKQIDLIRSCDDSAWEKQGLHPEYDQYSLEIVIRHVLMHDGFHMYRMEELWLAKDEVLTKM
jgi:uncharacterized damage-inducible protein DinB